MMGKKVNWGILGCAAIAKARTIPGLLQAENANLYAVASRGKENAEEFQQMYSAEKHMTVMRHFWQMKKWK